MPIFEYSCRQCGNITEFLTGVGGRDPDIRCGKCGSTDMNKILSASNIAPSGSIHAHGLTCCGREERCSTPSCSTGEACRRDHR